MTKFKLLASTAVIVVSMALSAPVKAEETSWYKAMTQSVKNWFSPQEETTADIKAYLDEVTIAVPPMTGEEASQIEPAAGGDYQPTLDEALEQDNQSFNSAPVFSNNGSVAAFEDPISAEDLANIMPAAGDSVAAGDAEEIVDESIVVVEETTEESTTTEATTEMDNALDNLAEATQEQAAESTDAAVEAETTIVEDVTEATNDAVDSTTEAVVDTYEAAKDMATDAMDAVTPDTENEVEGTTAY